MEPKEGEKQTNKNGINEFGFEEIKEDKNEIIDNKKEEQKDDINEIKIEEMEDNELKQESIKKATDIMINDEIFSRNRYIKDIFPHDRYDFEIMSKDAVISHLKKRCEKDESYREHYLLNKEIIDSVINLLEVNFNINWGQNALKYANELLTDHYIFNGYFTDIQKIAKLRQLLKDAKFEDAEIDEAIKNTDEYENLKQESIKKATDIMINDEIFSRTRYIEKIVPHNRRDFEIMSKDAVISRLKKRCEKDESYRNHYLFNKEIIDSVIYLLELNFDINWGQNALKYANELLTDHYIFSGCFSVAQKIAKLRQLLEDAKFEEAEIDEATDNIKMLSFKQNTTQPNK